MSSRIILHIDLNQFFATCEQLKNPQLVGKPLIVGGDGRSGIVSTASYEARKFGIHSGMPTFQAKMLCKDLIICGCDFKYYELMSKEFINYIKKFSPLVEQVSVDECFVDITDSYKQICNGNIDEMLFKIQNGLFEKTKLRCSIGVAPTKFLAKMGSDIKKPMGITIIRKRDIKSKIFPLPIKSYFGIGKKTYPKLEAIGIDTIGKLYYALKQKNTSVSNILGNMCDYYIKELEGNSDDVLNTKIADPKSIGVTRTLSSDSNDQLYLNDYLLNLAKGVIKDLISKNLLTKTITICFKDADYENAHFKVTSFSKSFNEPIDDENKILKSTSELFYKSYDGRLIRLIGFSVKNLKEKHEIVKQLTFDNFEQNEKEDKTKMIISELNRKTNSNTFIRLSDLKKK